MDLQEYDNNSGGRRIIQVMKLLGLWYYEGSAKMPYLLYSCLLHFTISIPFTIFMAMDVVHATDLEKFTNIMYLTLTELGMVAKLFNVWFYAKLLVDFFETLSGDKYFELREKDERLKWQHAQRTYARIVLFYVFIGLGAMFTGFVGVLFSAKYELPFPYAPPFNWHTPHGYWCAYLYELLAMLITFFANYGFDMIQCYMLLQLSLCFKLICGRLECMGELRSGTAVSRGFSEQQLYRQFVDIVKLHARIKNLSRLCQTYISFPFLIQIMCSSFVLCFSAYRLQKLSILSDPMQFLTFVQVNLIMILEIFLPCYYGNEVIAQSSALNNATYNSEWFRCSPGLRKYLVIYMAMLQRPLRVRAADFFDISLEIFTNTMKNTYSLMALLLNMNN
ncbi:odorant receptor 94a-like [Ceratitis capitata]|uniref:odorant receptor 94a-like n=1 Tax=Ceratitis capitata TaxID=7213 RepID=UPI000A0FA6E9|nr:odorant receptor 94a-like [Ceratitis capitata]